MNKNQQSRSPQFLRKRKFLTMLPLLATPFLTLFFWALGGGQRTMGESKSGKGLNFELPGANTADERTKDKMSYYDQAALDSAKLREQKKNDPYYRGLQEMEPASPAAGFTTNSAQPSVGINGNQPAASAPGTSNANEQRIYQKLNQLNAAMAQSPESPMVQSNQRHSSPGTSSVSSADVDRLERMMLAMNQPGEPDAEMQQLNGVLEKIMNIQNPELLQEKLRKASEQRKGRVFPITSGKPHEVVSSLDRATDKRELGKEQANGFYSFDQPQNQTDSQNAVQAVIHETQTLVNGSTVKLRLASDIYINGVMIPRETFVYGTASLNGERLTVRISGIRYGNNLLPVELSVFDMDGLDGIYIPGAISRDVAKDGADKSIQQIGFNTLDPSIGMQAASAGIETAKSLFSKKVKLVRVTVKAGYQVLLRDDKQKQDTN